MFSQHIPVPDPISAHSACRAKIRAVPKRQRAGALQDAGANDGRPAYAKRLGVRRPSAAFPPVYSTQRRKARRVSQRSIFTLRFSAFSAPLRFFWLPKSPQKKTKRPFDDGEIHLLANQPFAPGDGPENEVHDGPEQAAVNRVSNHRAAQRQEEIDKSGQLEF